MKINTDNVVVTTVMGDNYKKAYEKTFKKSQVDFTKKIGTDFIFIDKDIEVSPNHSHPSWQKLLMFRLPDISKYKKVLFIDADVYVTKHAKNPFLDVGGLFWAMAKNKSHIFENVIDGDLELYKYCPEKDRPNFMLNAGVFVVDKRCSPILENIFYLYKEQPCYDNGPFSYHIYNSPNGMILSHEFNTVVLNYIKANGCSLSSVLMMYRGASFLHFVANKWMSMFYFIRWFDSTNLVFLKEVVIFFGNKRYDFLTGKLFKFFERSLGIYNYRIKRSFSKLFV